MELNKAKELKKERSLAFKGAIRDDVSAVRIPTYSFDFTWKFFDSGFTLQDCIYNYDNLLKACLEYQQRYDFDVTYDSSRNPMRVGDAVGYNCYTLDGDKLNFVDVEQMSSEDYPLFLEKGFLKFYFENMIPHLAGFKTKDEAVRKYARACEETYLFFDYIKRANGILQNEYGIPAEAPYGTGANGLDQLFNYCRGIKGLSSDLRRKPQMVEDALKLYYEESGANSFFDTTDWNAPEADECCWHVWMPMLSHTILSPKQFERFMWPYMKDFMDRTVAHDITAEFFVEGGMLRFVDFFRECPSGHFVLWQEEDDIREVKKALPNLCHMGGLSSVILGKGTPEENIEQTKKVIDDVGYDGKLILTTYKFISYRNDCTRENLKAVMDFAKEYGRIK